MNVYTCEKCGGPATRLLISISCDSAICRNPSSAHRAETSRGGDDDISCEGYFTWVLADQRNIKSCKWYPIGSHFAYLKVSLYDARRNPTNRRRVQANPNLILVKIKAFVKPGHTSANPGSFEVYDMATISP